MKKSLNIRQFYQPLQPVVSGTNGSITYKELPPSEEVQEFISCYWQLKTTRKLAKSFCYRVVADGCIDIFFELKNPQRSFVMGLATRYTEFPLGRSFNYVGIRFLPTAFSRLFRMTALELTDRCETLGSVDPEAAAFISRSFHPVLTFQEQKSILDGYFLNHIRHAPVKRDPRVCRALHTILINGGDLQLARDLDPGLSPRQLRRLFNQDVGGSPKTFSRIIRFQHVLLTAKIYHNIRMSHFFDAGYYDQSHFIKEFSQFYGQSPSKVFGG